MLKVILIGLGIACIINLMPLMALAGGANP